MQIIRVDNSNIGLLERFIASLGNASESFRYYNTRSVDIIKNHLITILLADNNTPIAYGHLDSESGIIWLGIAVLPDYQGAGYGNIIMNELITVAKKLKLKEIALTVDNVNSNAIKLYKKFNFAEDFESETYTKYILKL